MLSKRQKIKGPLQAVSTSSSPSKVRSKPQVPVAQALTQATLEDAVGVWPSTNEAPEISAKALTFDITHASPLPLQHATQEVLRPQDLSHLLPYCEEVSGHSIPDGFVYGILRCPSVFTRNSRREVVL
jgi:hypothetical protein